jgi:hypothetical protein
MKHRHPGKYHTRKGIVKRKPLHPVRRAAPSETPLLKLLAAQNDKYFQLRDEWRNSKNLVERQPGSNLHLDVIKEDKKSQELKDLIMSGEASKILKSRDGFKKINNRLNEMGFNERSNNE